VIIKKPRNRILIVRLTQDEYDAVQSKSSEERSLSDYVRNKILGSMGDSKIDDQLTEIKTTVVRLAELLEKN